MKANATRLGLGLRSRCEGGKVLLEKALVAQGQVGGGVWGEVQGGGNWCPPPMAGLKCPLVLIVRSRTPAS